jgi:hypothetical protein
MSKADICSIPIRSRRAVLGGMAVAAAFPIATATPAVPAARAAADPIFAALDAFYRADAAFMAWEGDEDGLEELGNVHSADSVLVVQTRPTTLAGLVALTTWVREQYEWLDANESNLPTGRNTAIAAAVNEAAKALSGKAVA